MTITCICCNRTGMENDPSVFYNLEETPEESRNCSCCNGTGEIEVDNPGAVRASWIIAQLVQLTYPEY